MSGALQIRRWIKGSHDRLYVRTASGVELGWYDLRSGQERISYPGMGIEFRAAVERWRREHPDWRTTASPRPPAATPTGRVDEDLAGRRAGHTTLVRAEQLRLRNPALRILAAVFGVRTRDRPWRVGAAGEAAVGRQLDKLRRRGWHVLHGVELGHNAGDVDHLLIGRFGVFTVNTKHHPGAELAVTRRGVLVRGQPQPYVLKAHREADRVRRALVAALGTPVNVVPLLAMYGYRRLTGWIRHRPSGVQVLPAWAIARWLRLPGRAVLTPDQINVLYAAGRRASTWRDA